MRASGRFQSRKFFIPASLSGTGDGGKRRGCLSVLFVFAACPFARASSKRI
jgi:hypothetical protein